MLKHRAKFCIVCRKAEALADAISRRPKGEALDIDNAGMRLTLDVVGLVGHSAAELTFAMNLSSCLQGVFWTHIKHDEFLLQKQDFVLPI